MVSGSLTQLDVSVGFPVISAVQFEGNIGCLKSVMGFGGLGRSVRVHSDGGQWGAVGRGHAQY